MILPWQVHPSFSTRDYCNNVFVDQIPFYCQYLLFTLFNLVHITGHPRIIHRDIKSSNILLDNNFEARVCRSFSQATIRITLFCVDLEPTDSTFHFTGFRLWACQISS